MQKTPIRETERLFSGNQSKIEKARKLYFAGKKQIEIAKEIGVSPTTIRKWKVKDKWDEIDEASQISSEDLLRDLKLWANQKIQNGLDDLPTNEFNRLDRTLKRISDLEKTINKPKKERSEKIETVIELVKDASEINWEEANKRKNKIKKGKDDTGFYEYQLEVRKDKSKYLMYVKPRSVGMSYEFSFEMIERAVEEQIPQLVISLSLGQALQCRDYCIEHARNIYGLKVFGSETLKIKNSKKGDTIIKFLGSAERSVQAFHGDVNIDEFLKIPNFEAIFSAAKPMCISDKFRMRMWSAVGDETAYGWRIWMGEIENLGWSRHMLTIDEAFDKGFDQATKEDLLAQYPEKRKRDQVFYCIPTSEGDTYFESHLVDKCYIPQSQFPKITNKTPIIIGYDPGKRIDRAAIAVMAYIDRHFYLLESYKLKNQDYKEQAEMIKKLIVKYPNLVHLAIDVNNVGEPVAEQIEPFFKVTRYHSSRNDQRQKMLIKTDRVMREARLYFSQETDIDKEIGREFMNFEYAKTRAGDLTVKASRKYKSHSDLAIAIMHAILYEPLIDEVKTREDNTNIPDVMVF